MSYRTERGRAGYHRLLSVKQNSEPRKFLLVSKLTPGSSTSTTQAWLPRRNPGPRSVLEWPKVVDYGAVEEYCPRSRGFV